MKSKTLKLIEQYYRIIEQDEQDPNAVMQETPPEAVTPEVPAEEPETIPLSSQAEIRYIEDVVLAALMEPRPSGSDRIALENFLDLLKRPDAIQRIQSSGKTAKDIYQTQILPIIRPAQEGQELRDNLDAIS